MTASSNAAVVALTLALAGCDTGPKPIQYGQDQCAECKMTFVDPHYGSELITAKGKVFKFDDVQCLLTFQRRTPSEPAARTVIIDFNRANTFIETAQALYLQHGKLRSPMGSGIAAFATEAELESARSQLGNGGKTLRWPEVTRNP